MKIAIIGNGIIGLQTAYRLIKRAPEHQLLLIGPSAQTGSASLAAAAMLNSFCEVETGTLQDSAERERFLFNRAATSRWPVLLRDITQESGLTLNEGFGTFLVANSAPHTREGENFDAVLHALEEFGEPYDTVRLPEIPNYRPASMHRDGRAIFLPREGWVNPVLLLEALRQILKKSGRVEFVDALCDRVVLGASAVIEAAELRSGERVWADAFILCPGANVTRILDKSRLGIDVMKVFYGVGATLLLATGEQTLRSCVRTPNRGVASGIYGAPQDPGHTLIGASNYISSEPAYHPRASSVHALLQSAIEQIHSDFSRSELVRINLGWRPVSADTLPLIGKTSISNLLLATGTRRDGLHCSPLISEYLCDLLLQGTSSQDLSLFHPERKKIRVGISPDMIE